MSINPINLNQVSLPAQTLNKSRVNRYPWLPMTLVMVLATALSFYRIDAEGLWIDELTSVENAQGPLWKVRVRPLYFVLLKVWLYFGESDAWLRSLSVVFAIATTFLLYRLGRRLLGETEGIIAATLLTLSPLFLNHAQEVRMYVLCTCMGLAGTLCLANALTDEKAKGPTHISLAGWCFFRVLALLAVPLNLTLLLPDVIIYGLHFRQRRSALIRFGIGLGLIILLWSPFVLSVVQATAPDSAYAAHHPGRNPPELANLVRTLKFWTVWPFAIQASAISSGFYKVVTLLLAGVIGAALVQKHKTPGVLWAAAWFMLPLVPILAYSFISIPIWVNRYLLFISPYLFLVIAAGLSRLWRQWRIAAVILALVYLIAAGGGLVRYYSVQDRPDYKFITETIEQYKQPADVVVWGLFAQKVVLNHYSLGETRVYENKTRGVDSEADIDQWLDNFPDISSRLWLVIKVKEKDYPQFEQQIKARYNLKKTFDYEQGSKVILLSQQKSVTPQK